MARVRRTDSNDDDLRSYMEGVLARDGGASAVAGAPSGLFADRAAMNDQIEASIYAQDDRERDIARRAHAKLVNRQRLTPEETGLYEAIVLPTRRPAIIVAKGTITSAPSPWRELREPVNLRRIERAIAAVGRVELIGHHEPYGGTAFVVGSNLLMTNRHVARIFSEGAGQRMRFIDGMGAAMDFARERVDRGSGRSLPVARVVLAHPYWDMALLSVEGVSSPPLKLRPIESAESKGRKVVVIGHPARDDSNPVMVMHRVFGDRFGIKRVAPGHSMGAREHDSGERTVTALAHDSSTLGGNSGSLVLDLATGDVIGLHFAGHYKKANFAVPAFELARDSVVVDAGVSFTSGASTDPAPWQPLWTDAERVTTTPRRSAPAAAGTEMRVRFTLDITVRMEDENRADA
jgi:endonuclease G, mitochondrial